MDVTFVTHHGDEFTVEIGYFDTVLEIKEKIERYEGIPVGSQTLAILNIGILSDDKNTEFYGILHKSRVEIYIDENIAKPELRRKVFLQARMGEKEVCFNPFLSMTIAQVKRRVQGLMQLDLPTNQFELHFNNKKMNDDHFLGDYSESYFMDIDVVVSEDSS